MKFETIESNPTTINLKELINDRAWELSEGLATHSPCMDNTKLILYQPLVLNANYTVSFTIKNIEGSLGIGLDTIQQTYTTKGAKTFVFSPTKVTDKITFWGTGSIELETVNVVKKASTLGSEAEHTITWDETNNFWLTFKSYRPEAGFSMFSDLFTIKDGNMFVHKKDTNSYNVFYGQTFDTIIDFPLSSVGVKTYKSLAIHANKIIGTTENGIKTQLGHVSDLLEVDFETKEGVHYANYLRDKLTGIVSGDRLKGRYIVLKLQAKGSTKLQLFKVVSKSVISTPNE